MSSGRWKVWATLICFLGFTLTVHAAAPTGKELLAWCTAKDRSEELAGCMAYVRGFVHGFKVGRSEEPKRVVCLPPDLMEEEAEEAIAVFGRTMRTIGKSSPVADEQADVVLAAVLGMAFRCA